MLKAPHRPALLLASKRYRFLEVAQAGWQGAGEVVALDVPECEVWQAPICAPGRDAA